MSGSKNNWIIGVANSEQTAPKMQSVDELGSTNCRVCLKLWKTTKWPISQTQAQIYQQVTGFKISKTDITVMCCTNCSKYLDDLVAFRKRAVQVEMKLKLARIKNSKSTNSFNVSMANSTAANSLVKPEPSLSQSFPESHHSSSMVDDDDDGNDADMFENSYISPEVSDNEDVKTYSCKLCPRHLCFEAWTPEELQRHMDEAHEIKDKKKSGSTTEEAVVRNTYTLMCQICAKQFKSKDHFDSHQIREHNEELNLTELKCSHCSRKFGNQKQLKSHIAENHTERCCPDCGKKFKSKQVLINHQKALHTEGDNQYSCTECNKTFKTKKYLQQHQQTHKKSGYVCPICHEKNFSFAAAIRTHIKIHHPNLQQPPRGTNLKNYDWSRELANL